MTTIRPRPPPTTGMPARPMPRRSVIWPGSRLAFGSNVTGNLCWGSRTVVSVRTDPSQAPACPDAPGLQTYRGRSVAGGRPAVAQEALDLLDQVVAFGQALLVHHRLEALHVRPGRGIAGGQGVQVRSELPALVGQVALRQVQVEVVTERPQERERRARIRPGHVVRDLREVAKGRDPGARD